jgi:hypothetical protein
MAEPTSIGDLPNEVRVVNWNEYAARSQNSEDDKQHIHFMLFFI